MIDRLMESLLCGVVLALLILLSFFLYELVFETTATDNIATDNIVLMPCEWDCTDTRTVSYTTMAGKVPVLQTRNECVEWRRKQ
jgi:hypothetical protein